MREIILGVDVSGTIIKADTTTNEPVGGVSIFSERYLEVEPVPDAFQVIRALAHERFEGRIVLISKCGENVEKRIRGWLDHHDFYKTTGVSMGNVIFCRHFADKKNLCRRFDVTHFIDGRLEALSYLNTTEVRYLLNGHRPEIMGFRQYLNQVRQVHSWAAILNQELGTVKAAKVRAETLELAH